MELKFLLAFFGNNTYTKRQGYLLSEFCRDFSKGGSGCSNSKGEGIFHGIRRQNVGMQGLWQGIYL